MKRIRLTRGYIALIDDDDYPLAVQFRWRADVISRVVYARRTIRLAGGVRATQSMHTLITGWLRVDHINHDGLDNRRSNLREATKAQNEYNSRSRLNTSSRFKGVTWHERRGRWQAQIGAAGGGHRYLGLFDSEEDAARAYDEAARGLFGEFALVNLPPTGWPGVHPLAP